MSKKSGAMVLAVVGIGVGLVAACHTDETQPVVAPMNSGTVPGTVPPPPTATGANTVAPPPTATTPPAPGQMAVPGPMAFACTSDAQCGLHHCNTQYGKCAFPCASDTDCLPNNTCIGAGQPVATCIPRLQGQ